MAFATTEKGVVAMNNDFIRRSDALKILNIDNSVFEWWGYSKLKELPAVDAVEVVRCGRCEHEQYCRIAQHLGIDGYCSKGERRSE